MAPVMECNDHRLTSAPFLFPLRISIVSRNRIWLFKIRTALQTSWPDKLALFPLFLYSLRSISALEVQPLSAQRGMPLR